MNRIWRVPTFAVFLCFTALAGAQTEVPHVFQAGTPARASEVNENFDALESGINQNAADIASIPVMSGLSREAAQIQSALYLTSGLRWLVADLYYKQGRLPGDNAEAGAPAPDEWSSRFVLQSQVETGGVIRILFGSDAAPGIANGGVLLTPIDPGSGVLWFDCGGDGNTDPFLAELDCAFADDPYQPVYVPRTQVLTAFDLLSQSNAQSLVQDYFNSFGVWPADNSQAGLSPSSQYQNRYVDQLSVSNGIVSVVFGGAANTPLQGRTLTWEPTDNGASIEWDCSSADIPDVVLPAECR